MSAFWEGREREGRDGTHLPRAVPVERDGHGAEPRAEEGPERGEHERELEVVGGAAERGALRPVSASLGGEGKERGRGTHERVDHRRSHAKRSAVPEGGSAIARGRKARIETRRERRNVEGVLLRRAAGGVSRREGEASGGRGGHTHEVRGAPRRTAQAWRAKAPRRVTTTASGTNCARGRGGQSCCREERRRGRRTLVSKPAEVRFAWVRLFHRTWVGAWPLSAASHMVPRLPLNPLLLALLAGGGAASVPVGSGVALARASASRRHDLTQ